MDIIEEIKKLKELFDQGAITEEEFQVLKKDILTKSGSSISSEESNTEQFIQKNESGKKNTEEAKSKKSQNKSVKGKRTKRNPKSKTTKKDSEWSAIFMGFGAIAGFVLGFVFGMRYDSFTVTLIIWGITIAAPLVIFFFMRVHFSKPLSLFLLFALYIILIAVPIGNVNPYFPDEVDNSYSPSSSSKTHTCSYCGKAYTGYGYHHIFDDCVTHTEHYNSNMCSKKCCMESWNASHR